LHGRFWKLNTSWIRMHGSFTTSCLSTSIFVVNDGNKLDLILLQTMCCVICHFVCQNYSVGNTIKRKKSRIYYNQQHGSTSMKNHILDEHPIA
jgi:hypothetical protein